MHSFPCVLRNSLPHSCVLLPVFMSVHYSVPDPSFLLSLLSFDSPFHHVLLVWLFPSSLPAVSIHSSCLVFLPSVDARTDMHISNIQPPPWETILSLSNPFFLIENQSSLSSLLFHTFYCLYGIKQERQFFYSRFLYCNFRFSLVQEKSLVLPVLSWKKWMADGNSVIGM